MKTYILYTTSSSDWYQKEADIFAEAISKTKGRGEVKIEVRQKKPRWMDTEIDEDGDEKPNWAWFRGFFSKHDYDGVIFHMTDHYRRKFDISRRINGSRNKDNKDYPEFWVCCGKEKAEHYEFSEFQRLLFHEHAHFDEDLDDKMGNLLTQTSVHDFDYRLHKIHLYHLVVDYRGQAIKDKVNKLMNKVIKLALRFI